MSLPASWVDQLFARLATRYGAAFLRQWPDADPAVIKADWSEVLSGVTGPQIAWALDCLPSDRVPNAMHFRDLCRGAPAAPQPRLPEPKADPARVARELAKLREAANLRRGLSPAASVIANIDRLANAKGGMSSAQRDMVASCTRVLSERDREELARMGVKGFERAEPRAFVAAEDVAV
jgi:hypothetical protein